jgi:uncharacterized linocin/CFP29 family protein
VNHLYRELAPMSELAWDAVEDEARRSIRHFLAGRHLFPLEGPHGYRTEAVPTGQVAPIGELEGASAAVLRPSPMVELRTSFSLSRRDIEVLDRGGDVDLEQVVEGSRRIAGAEDRLVFDGVDAVGIMGAAASSPYDVVAREGAIEAFPGAVARAVEQLRAAGVDGPYGIGLGPQLHQDVLAATEHGYPVVNHLRRIIEGPIVWAPTLGAGAVVVSMRGDDFAIHSGLDFSIRYRAHDREWVELELIETVTFRNKGPDAAIRIG